MACILKLPGESKGIITFTTIEKNQVYTPNKHEDLLKELKDDWIVGLHYNGPQQTHPEIFDFGIAGSNFVDNLNNRPFITIDAGRLAPLCFKPSHRKKHWDILYVSRCTKRKNVEFFFKSIKKIFNQGYNYRVLLITTVPEDPKRRFPSNPEEMYLNLFTKEEQDRFTFLPFYYSGFPLDRETLAGFYKSSRVFVHPSTDEKGRVRNAGYAWASEIPVVGLNLYNSELEENGFKQPPYYYEAETYNDIPQRLIDAVEEHRNTDPDLSNVRELFSITYTEERMKSEFETLFEQLYEPFVDEHFYFENLDIRIARHHGMDTATKNEFAISFEDLLKKLQDVEQIKKTIETGDPEEDIAKAFFDRTTNTDSKPVHEVELPVPSSEQSPRLVQLLKQYHLYSLAKDVYDRSALVKKIYRKFYN